MGYKGFPVLASHQPFHVVKGVVVDYLHCVLLGVVKTLLNIWLDTSHRAQEYYIGNKVNAGFDCTETIIYPCYCLPNRPKT